MTLKELLAELRNNILHDRSSRVSGDDDCLWSDETLVRYINEAHRRFARRALVIVDGTSDEASKIKLVAGQAEYPLHPSVIAVRSAKVVGQPVDLIRAGHTAFNAYMPPESLYFDVNQFVTTAPGMPRAFSTDEHLSLDDDDSFSVTTIRMYPVPSIDQDGLDVQLRVIRGPLEDFDLNQLNVVPEIPSDHHMEMLDWAAYLALRIVDRDAEDRQRAADFRASFEDHVRLAKAHMLKKLFAPQGWRFGQGGFSGWER